MKLSVIDDHGRKAGAMTVSPAIWQVPENRMLLAQAVRVYRANQRQSAAAVLTRGGVEGSRRKLWRQKGTGRARHGDAQAPQFVGGGVAHGPTGKQRFSRRLPKRMRRNALLAALSAKQREGKLTVVGSLAAISKTKDAAALLSRLGLSGVKTLFLGDGVDSVTVRAFRNIGGVRIEAVGNINALTVLSADRLVATRAALEALERGFNGAG